MIDGKDLPAYALSVSDALPEDVIADRVGTISDLSDGLDHLRFICVRDDAMDPRLFIETARKVRGTGLGLILDSPIASSLSEARKKVDGDPLLVCSVPSNPIEMTGGSIIALSDQDVAKLSESAKAIGGRLVLDPMVGNMKATLESTVALRRAMDAGRCPEAPIMVRAWSGEYALAVASVSFLRGCTLAVFDSLDVDGCRAFESVISTGINRFAEGPL